MDRGKVRTMSKGSGRRPTKVDKATADANWERIFKSKQIDLPLMEKYRICATCMAEVTRVQGGDEVLDWCGDCGRIVEGNTLKCIRELDHVDD